MYRNTKKKKKKNYFIFFPVTRGSLCAEPFANMALQADKHCALATVYHITTCNSQCVVISCSGLLVCMCVCLFIGVC